MPGRRRSRVPALRPGSSHTRDRGRLARGLGAEPLEPRIMLSDGRDLHSRIPIRVAPPAWHGPAVMDPGSSTDAGQPGRSLAIRRGEAGAGPAQRHAHDRSGPAINRVQGVAFQVPGTSGQDVAVTFTLTKRQALYRNEVGIFRVDDADGRIGGLRPGDRGYAAAALAESRRVILFARMQPRGTSIRVALPAGASYGMYLIQDGSSRRFLDQVGRGDPGLHAFFTFPGANFDRFAHMRWTGQQTVSFEDMSHGGDRDFNDAVVHFVWASPTSKSGDSGPGRQYQAPTPSPAPPTAPIFDLDPASDTAPVGDHSTMDAVVTLDGQTDPYATVALGGLTTTADAQGRFSFSRITLAPGANALTTTASNQYGATPYTRTITRVGSFADGLAGWTVHQDGGTTAGQGTAAVQSGSAVIGAGDSFDVTLSHAVTIDGTTPSLSFAFAPPTFGASGSGAMNDAFEASLVDAQGRPLVPTTAANRDTFFNLTDGQPALTGTGTTISGNTVTVDLSGVPAGSTGTLVFRLLHNDGAPGTSATITGVQAPLATAAAPAATLGSGTAQVASLLAVPPALADFDTRTLAATASTPAGPVTSPPAASGLSVSVISPADGAAIAPGQTILVSGRASTGGTGRVVSVTVAGTQAEALDAAGDFFTRLTVAPGQNKVAVQATDDQGHTATATLTMDGASPPSGSVDVSWLADVSGSFTAGYGRTSLDYGTGVVYADVAVRNVGQYPAGSPLYVAVEHISDPTVRVRDAAGTTADGLPYFDFTGLVTGGMLTPGASSGTLSLAFSDPHGSHFTYDLMFLGALDRPPTFTSVPIVQAVAGKSYEYDASAVSLSGLALSYSLVSGPSGMKVDPSTGKATWAPASGAVGNQDVVIRADDGHGGSSEQRYTLSTIVAPPNRPPVFDSTPVVSGNVDTPYAYAAHASDPDGNSLTYGLQAGPSGMTVDASTGQVSWTPTVSQLGDQPVSLTVSDGHGGTASQTSTVHVAMAPGDHSPIIVSTPVTQVLVPPPVSDPALADLSSWTPYEYHPNVQPPANWVLDPSKTVATQTVNGDPSLLLSDFTLKNTEIKGSFQVAASDDVDFIGFVFGYQDPQHFYVFDWKGGNNGFPGPDTQPGMSVKVVDAATPASPTTPLDYHDLGPTAGNGDRVRTLYHNGVTWQPYTDYEFTLDYHPGTFTISVNQGNTVLATTALDDPTYASGKFGFYNASQDGARYSHFETTTLPPVAYAYPVRGIDPDNDPLTYSLTAAPAGMTIDPKTGAIGWTVDNTQVGSYPVTVRVDDGRGGSDTQSYTIDVTGAGLKINSVPTTTLVLPPPEKAAGGSVLITGGDPDWHAVNGGNNPTAARNFNKQAIRFVTDPAYNTFAAAGIHKFLVLDINYTAQAVALSGYTQGVDFDVCDPSTLNAAIGKLGTTYDAIVIGSVFAEGSPVTQGVLDTLKQHSAGLQRFVDAGGGLYAMVESHGNVPPGATDLFTFLPTVASTSFVNEYDAGNAVTPYGATLGFTNADVNGNYSHSVFLNTAGLNVVEKDAAGQILTLAGRGLVSSGGFQSGGLYTYDVATDAPAGTSLHFSLTAAPSGMTINPSTGHIAWVATAGDVGRHDITVLVDAGSGRSATQNYVLGVYLTPPAEIDGTVKRDDTGAGLPGWTVYLDLNHNGQPDAGEPSTATDSQGRYAFTGLQPGSYTVVEPPPPGWVQTSPQQGGVPVPQTVTLATGQVVAGIDFAAKPNATSPGQGAPFFTSTPASAGLAGQAYLYGATATDPAGRPLTFDLVVKPDGMTVEPATGMVAWRPTDAEAGPNTVILRARDDRGGVVLQSFTVNVAASNHAPVITSTPFGPAVAGYAYQYAVIAQDPDGDTLTYALNHPPAGMTIDPKTGVLAWTPTTGQVGTATVDIVVTDGRGGGAEQSFRLPVVAGAPDQPPVISSTPRDAIGLNRTYLYAIQATSPIGSPLTYRLVTAPTGMKVDASGLVTWNPTQAQLGANPVTIEVDDARGGSATQSVTITVSASVTSQPPTITSVPSLADIVGRPYAYDAKADDPQGDPLVWFLDAAPAGMSIDPARGTIRWTPSADQVGPQAVTVRVVDAEGGSDSQSFTINVAAADIPPGITSTPTTVATVGSSYAYPVRAVDNLGMPLTYSLSTAPTGMSIDPKTGLILWTPTSGQTGPQAVAVRVDDGLGGTTTQGFTVVVSASGGGQPPAITSTPPSDAIVGQGYTYPIMATDPTGVVLTYALLAAPVGMSIDAKTGAVTWTPTAAEVGPQTVTVSVTDPTGAGAAQQFSVLVHDVPKPPTIASSPVTAVTAGLAYHYDVRATDPNGTPLTYTLAAGPKAMTIDANGRITWPTGPGDIGPAHVDVVVKDALGLSVDLPFDIAVTADTQAPSVQVKAIPDHARIGDTVTFQVQATDNVGVASKTLTVGGTILPLDSSGAATMKLTQAGSLAVVATAADAAGNKGQATATLPVIDPTVTGSPTVAITSPADGTTVTTFTEIDGTVADAHLTSWSLDLYTVDGDKVTHIADGTQPVNTAKLGTFDPTLLQNDTYDLRLTATNTGGYANQADVQISVAGNLKLGNFKLSFTDLTVPVSGIPITVSRTYDTLTASTSQDFGYGWRLEFGDTNLQTSVPKTRDEADGFYNAFRNGTRVYVTLPGGQREGFTFTPGPAPGLAGGFLGIIRPAFTPDPGVTDHLSVNSFDLRQNDDGTYSDYNGDLPYNPADPSFASVYTLTTKDGTIYTIDPQSGKLDTVADRNGNTLTFSADGITSKSGEKVTFQRDPQGRITAVIDPSGHAILYAYDAAGDLVSVTDRDGNTTRLDYRTDFAHYLQDVIDPLGRTGVKTLYNDQGQLIGMVDAAGKTVQMAYDPTHSTETVTDALGNPTTYEYDSQGNVVTQIDARGGVTKNTYDANNDLLTQTDPLGRTTTNTYDAAGNLLTTTDPMGHVTRSTYGPHGVVLTTTDPLGNTTTNAYDPAGNLLSTIDPSGHVTRMTYDSSGNPTTMTDALGNTTNFVYDSKGHVIQSTDALGHTTSTTYDAAGNPLTVTTTLTTATGVQKLVTTTTYDAAGRVTSVTDALGFVTRTQYNADGEKIATTAPLGNVTKYVYDARRELIETDHPDGTSTKTEYDAAGHATAQIDQEGRRTTMQYDALGRLIQTTAPDGTSTSTQYDTAGQVTAQVDELGHTTTFGYDANGNQVSVKDALGDVTTTTYDAAGRAVATTDPLGHTTKSVYDASGRLIKTVYADGTTTSTTYDAAGRAVAKTDQLNRTTKYQYDVLGHLTAVVDTLNQTTSYTYDEAGDLITQTDANGHVTAYEYDGLGHRIATVLPMGQKATTTYDADGNVASTTDYNGATITDTYDAMGRLVTETFPDGTAQTYTYTPTGQRASDTVPGYGTTTYQYDSRDRLLKKTTPDGTAISYTYDKAGNRTAAIIPAGTTTYTFDALNRMATVTDPEGGVTTYTYDAAGNLVKTVFPNNTSEIRQYDSLNRLTDLEDDGPSGVIASYKYTLAANGRRDSVVEANGRTDQFKYDAIDRLIEEIITDPVNGNRGMAYTYDPVGNRLTMDDSNQGTTTYTYDANDRLLTATLGGRDTRYTYDNNGNMLSQITNVTDQVLYQWDAQNRLIDEITDPTDLNDITYRYDVDGNLISRLEGGQTVSYLIDTNSTLPQVLEEYVLGQEASVSYVIGNFLISQHREDQASYYLFDGSCNVRFLTGAGGKILDRYTYDAFGRLLEASGAVPNSYQFGGQLVDKSSGLELMRARVYTASLGRFLSQDPMPADPEQPVTANRYPYAESNPINRMDPTGRSDIGDSYDSTVSALAIGRTTTPARPGLPFVDSILIQIALEQAKDWAQVMAQDTSGVYYKHWFDENYFSSPSHNAYKSYVFKGWQKILTLSWSDLTFKPFETPLPSNIASDTIAYVYKNKVGFDHTIYINTSPNSFFSYPLDVPTAAKYYLTQAGILIHELSHLAQKTNDIAYGVTNAIAMADIHPEAAIHNADNYGFEAAEENNDW